MCKPRSKFAGYVGNVDCRIRTTPFFDSFAEVRGEFSFKAECANWQEHQRWNAERVGSYASSPVQE